MLIVLLGCDGVGKTSVAEQLTAFLEGEYVKGNYLPPSKREFFTLRTCARARTELLIADRLPFPDDLVQSIVYDEESVFNFSDFRLMRAMLACGVIFVCLSASEDTIRRRLEERGDEVIEWGRIQKSIGPYEELFEKLDESYDVIHVNTEDMDASEVAARALSGIAIILTKRMKEEMR